MPDGSPNDIPPDHWAIVRDILQWHVQRSEVGTFSSRARGAAKRYSDLDLAVIGEEASPVVLTVALGEVRSHNHALTPKRYVSVADIEGDEVPFSERISFLRRRLELQFFEEHKLGALIRPRPARVGVNG